MKISYSQVRAAVNAHEGGDLLTAGGKRTFSARCTERGIEFTPTSTGKARPLSRAQIEPYIEYFNHTGSTRPSDYAYLNHSYVPAIFKIIIGQSTAGNPPKRVASDEMQIYPATGAQQGKTTSGARRPVTGTIMLKWMDDELSSCSPEVLLEWHHLPLNARPSFSPTSINTDS